MAPVQQQMVSYILQLLASHPQPPPLQTGQGARPFVLNGTLMVLDRTKTEAGSMGVVRVSGGAGILQCS